MSNLYHLRVQCLLLVAAITVTGRPIALAAALGLDSTPAASSSCARSSGAVQTCTTYPYPYLQDVTQESIVIMWQTCTKEVSRARYRPVGGEVWIEVSDTEPVMIHELQVTGLQSGETYEYQVSLDGTSQWTPAAPATFHPAPGKWQAYRVAAYGDSRDNSVRHAMVAESILNGQPDIVLHTGDLTDHGTVHGGWGPQFFEPAASLMSVAPIYPVLGNHEYSGEGHMWYYDMFSLPGNEAWYTFTYGCTRFIAVNSSNDRPDGHFEPGSEQYSWLEKELQSPEAKAARWQFVLFHYPPFTSGSHNGNEQPTEKHLVPLFEQHGVDLVLNGHSHQYERSWKDGIYYIVTGGGGAKLDDFPNVDRNPYSQVRMKEYHHVTLDVDCLAGTVAFYAWNTAGERIDGPIVLVDGPVFEERLYLPLAAR